VRNAIIVLLGLCSLVLLSCEPDKGGPAFGPYLMTPTETSLVVCWRTDVEADGLVLYGLTSSYGSTMSGKVHFQHEVTLTELIPDTIYHYKVISKSAGKVVFESADSTFKTATADSSAGVKFAFFAEVHNSEKAAAFNSHVLAFDPDLILDASDQVSNGHSLEQWKDFFSFNGPLWKKYPLLPAFGNHSYQGEKFYEFDKAETAHEVFSLPKPENWYSNRRGNTLFVVLDSTYRNNVEAKKKQVPWLEKTLKEATDGVDDPKFIIAMFHAPPYSSGVHGWELDQSIWTIKNFVSLFKKYGVDLVLCGHDKVYERSVVDGITYLQVATGSLRKGIKYPFNKKYSKVFFTDTFSALLITVTPDTIEFEAITPTGEVIDHGTVHPH